MSIKSLGFAAVMVLVTVLGVDASRSAPVSFDYLGAEDPNCAVQVLGGVNSCLVRGTFVLDSALFGTTQETTNATFELVVNGIIFDSFTFFPNPIAPTEIGYCTEYCNEVDTNSAGSIVGMDLFIHPPASIDNAIFLSSFGWSWDSFETGNGVFAGAVGVTINGESTIPLPATLPLLIASLGALGIIGWRRRETS